MTTCIRTTIVFGLISAVVVMPLASALAPFMGWSMALRLVLWLDLCVYLLLLCRWSHTGPARMLLPLGLLLGMAVWPGLYHAFFFVALGIFSWLRSGICFPKAPIRAMAAETITVGGGAGLVALLGPGNMLTWAAAIWLFFLVQALYFVIVPVQHRRAGQVRSDDRFEHSFRQARELLDG